ncbi:hypothetical protein BAE44_0021946 [Dichanthelium oligosanthes]|uniref:Uncharacterized protein n=1 Tax=Dichanthelium oligosanthes TaxID=888268 RepID=A0A1E5UW90_9POAL|nr:hypothetical protein BAE44_0021946 [Dichanthelium oligosanthes]
MAQSVYLLVPALLLLLVQAARSLEKCAPASVEVLQTSNGEKVGVNPVFEVLVRNRCQCAVRGVILCSEGFSSSVPVDPNVYRREGNDYLVGNGSLIPSGGEVRFRTGTDACSPGTDKRIIIAGCYSTTGSDTSVPGYNLELALILLSVTNPFQPALIRRH